MKPSLRCFWFRPSCVTTVRQYCVVITGVLFVLFGSQPVSAGAIPEVVAWGDNRSGQTNAPAGLSDVIALAAGTDHALALKSDGTLVAWGDNSYGKATVPVGLSNVVSIACGPAHNIALKSDGTVVAWGYWIYGQTNIPAAFSNVVAIGSAGDASLALTREGTVLSTSSGPSGQALLRGTNVVALSSQGGLMIDANGQVVTWVSGAISPFGPSNAVAVAAGRQHYLALTRARKVVAWGDNFYGQTNVPPGLSNVVSINAGDFHSIAVTSDGQIVAWGANIDPVNIIQLNQSVVPTGFSNAVAATAGQYFSVGSRTLASSAAPTITSLRGCLGVWFKPFWYQTTVRNAATGYAASNLPAGLTMDGQTGVITGVPTQLGFFQSIVSATNSYGISQVTLGITVNKGPLPKIKSPTTAVAFPGVPFSFQIQATEDPVLFGTTGLPPWLSINTGSGAISGTPPSAIGRFDVTLIASNLNGVATAPLSIGLQTLAAWGDNYAVDVAPSLASNVIALSASLYGNLGLRTDGSVFAWSGGSSLTELAVSNAVAVAAGTHQNLALQSDRLVFGWGDAGFSNAVAVAASQHFFNNATHSVALHPDGTVESWGGNFSGAPVPSDLGHVVAVDDSWEWSMALRSDGTLMGWGNNYYGVLSVPADVTNAVAFAAGWNHAVALRRNGTVACWGANESGQASPPAGLSNVIAVAAGDKHSAALRGDGTVVGWGDNTVGQLNIPSGISNFVTLAARGNHTLP